MIIETTKIVSHLKLANKVGIHDISYILQIMLIYDPEKGI